jgi:formamidopyrimidine-DNA glycosylase
MPELPEVETVRQRLAPLLVGKRISRVDVRRPDVVGYPAVAQFRNGLKGRAVVRAERRGKYLIFHLSDGKMLVIHLRLSGHLRLIENGKPAAYERIRFRLNNGEALVFIEPRALGRAYLVSSDEIGCVLKGLSRMGREPVEPEFNGEYLYEYLQRRRAKIKTVLLDQRVCAGVGNIYSDEALFWAGILPTRQANSLTRAEAERLARALKSIIRNGIRWLGTTMSDRRYLLPDGSQGKFQKRLAVFNREGQPCRVCKQKIKRIRVGNRSSYFCPECQR